MRKFIQQLCQKVLRTQDISLKEAERLLETGQDDIWFLFVHANDIRKKFRGDFIDRCAITNAKSGACCEDCAFCAQSTHHKTKVDIYPLAKEESILKKAEESLKCKANRFCIVTSGKRPTQEELKRICQIAKSIRKKFPKLKLDASLGTLDTDRAKALKDAGIERYNHNLETARSHFNKICTTHSFEDRLKTIEVLKKTGLEICSGGIFGLGESLKQRIEFAFFLKSINPDCIPINFLNPIKGTRLENKKLDSSIDFLKMIALYRFILPDKQIRICGGRQYNLRKLESLMFLAGADAILTGNYLTTKGNAPLDDLLMIKDLGLYAK